MTGHGGWPLNVFLTPEQLPVLRRHLLPARLPPRDARVDAGAAGDRRGVGRAARGDPRRRRGPARAPVRRRALSALLRAAARGRARRRGGQARGVLRSPQRGLWRPAEVSAGVCHRVPAAARRARDGARTLQAMAAGGIHDQLGGGFARYSVDATWTVPHFEKMLYDNALLARAYLHGFAGLGRSAPARGVPGHRSTGRCARCAAPRAASTPRSTPTQRASRAASTCGPSPS